MSRSSTRRLGFLLVFAMFVVAGFAYFSAAKPPVAKAQPRKVQKPMYPSWQQDLACANGNGSASFPHICIDGNLNANPNPAYIWDVQSDHGARSTHAVVIHWFGQRGGNLEVALKEQEQGGKKVTPQNCINGPIVCDKRGHCEAVVMPMKVGEPTKKCKFGLSMGKSLDPDDEIVINPCCM